LVLVRHGLSQCTVDAVVGGIKGCTGLAADGRTQAAALRDRLLRTEELADTDVVLTSVLPRAIETAEIIAPGLGRAAGLVAEQHEDLSELHPGDADGLTWDDYNHRYGVDMRADPYAPLAPGGESYAGFMLRVAVALRRVVHEHRDRNVVVVAHGGVISGAMQLFMNLPVQHPVTLAPDNTSLTEWRIEPDRHTLVRYNDAAHL
jgi:probable phosphoglycerate mutase